MYMYYGYRSKLQLLLTLPYNINNQYCGRLDLFSRAHTHPPQPQRKRTFSRLDGYPQRKKCFLLFVSALRPLACTPYTVQYAPMQHRLLLSMEAFLCIQYNYSNWHPQPIHNRLLFTVADMSPGLPLPPTTSHTFTSRHLLCRELYLH